MAACRDVTTGLGKQRFERGRDARDTGLIPEHFRPIWMAEMPRDNPLDPRLRGDDISWS